MLPKEKLPCWAD